jgi:hypothetical protein
MARVGGFPSPRVDLPSVSTLSLSYFGNAIPAGGKDFHGSAGKTFRGPLDGALKVRRVGKVHHLYLFGRKTFGHTDDLKFLSQFLEVNDLQDVGTNW